MNLYKINYDNINHVTELYISIYSSLDLPQYVKEDFGENPDALWDVLTGFISGQAKFKFYGVNKLAKPMYSEFYNYILPIFNRTQQWYVKLNKDFSFTIIDWHNKFE